MPSDDRSAPRRRGMPDTGLTHVLLWIEAAMDMADIRTVRLKGDPRVSVSEERPDHPPSPLVAQPAESVAAPSDVIKLVRVIDDASLGALLLACETQGASAALERAQAITRHAKAHSPLVVQRSCADSPHPVLMPSRGTSATAGDTR